MPYGIIVDTGAVFLGGLFGHILKKVMPEHVKESLTLICAFASMAIGVCLTIKVDTLGVVCLSLLFGTLVGELIHLEDHLRRGFSLVNKKVLGSADMDDYHMSMFLSVLVLCCTSGTGIFGALTLGMTGDSSVLIAKAVLDFFTVLIFATTLGAICSIIAIPQAAIFLALFFCAKVISPLLTDQMIGNFSAVGGVISIMTCFRVAKIKEMRIVNILPAMILVFPFTLLWSLFS